MEANEKLYEILKSDDVPAYHLSSFLDVETVPDNFFIFNNLSTHNVRADNQIIYESLYYQIYYYSSSPVGLRTIVKAKVKELEEAGITCGPIEDIGKIDRKFGLEFTAHMIQKF